MASTAYLRVESRALQNKVTPFGTFTGTPTIAYQRRISTDEVTKIYFAENTITGDSHLDLTDLTDVFGDPLAFNSVVSIQVVNTGAGALTVGGGTDALMGTDQVTVMAGRCFFSDAGWTVGTGFTNLAFSLGAFWGPSSEPGTATFQVEIFGT